MKVYLDNNATTKLDENILKELLPFLNENYANPSAQYDFARISAKAIYNSRESIATLINGKVTNLFFTSSATEANNTAIFSAINDKKNIGKRKILISSVEHPSVIKPVLSLEVRGYQVKRIRVNSNGELDLNDLEKNLSDEVALVSIMHANNETGIIIPVEVIGKILQKRGIPYHVDSVQALGKIEVDVNKINADFISFSGHKAHALKGIGALYVKDGVTLNPFILGGSQERNLRAGTENVTGIVSFGLAAKIIKEENHNVKIKQLRDYFEKELEKNITGIRINGKHTNRLPNTSNVTFEGVDGDSLLILLNENGISASVGSACLSGSLSPSPVLLAMGLNEKLARSTVRFSLSKYTTNEELNYALEVLKKVVDKLRT